MIGLLALAAAAVQCPVENAHYALRHHPGTTAYFRTVKSTPEWPSGVVFVVESGGPDNVSWWLPWLGGTDNLQNLASTTDIDAPDWQPPYPPDGGPRPHGDRQYIGTDANYDVIDDVPHRGKAAPAHILIPQAGSSHDHVFAKQFFDLVRCSPSDN